MPVDITEKYIRIRQHSPSKYVRLRTKTLSASQGIKAIIGFVKSDGSEVQSYLFDKTKWTVSKAQDWIKRHKASELLLAGKMNMNKVVFRINAEDLKFNEVDGKMTTQLQVLLFGIWKHPVYGKIKIGLKEIESFVKNFDNNVRRDIPITEGHSVGGEELPAIGWFKQLIDKGREGLWATVEWTQKGISLLKEKAYKYFSPEFYSKYEDPESHKKYSNVLVGGALTNMPYFKGLQAVMLSEFIFDENMADLKLEEVLEKDKAELTSEEKEFLKDNKDELNDEQKESLKDILEEKEPEETEEEKLAREEKENEEKEAKEKEEKEEEEKKGNEKMVQMSEKTLKLLERKADAGLKAMVMLRKKAAESFAESMIFGESNHEGPFLPKSQDKIVSFYLSLSEKQQAIFKELLDGFPKGKLFSELGKEVGVQLNASEQIEKFVEVKMSKNDKLSYREALDQVLADNPVLAEQLE